MNDIDPIWIVIASGVITGSLLVCVAALVIWRVWLPKLGQRIAQEVRSQVALLARRQSPPASERPTKALKVGVLPFAERPTLVHTPTLPGVTASRSKVVQTFVQPDEGPPSYDVVDVNDDESHGDQHRGSDGDLDRGGQLAGGDLVDRAATDVPQESRE